MKFYEEPIAEIERFEGFDELMWSVSDDDPDKPIIDPFTNK